MCVEKAIHNARNAKQVRTFWLPCEILHGQIHRPFRRRVCPASLVDVAAGNCQRALVDESGMIIN